MKSPQAPMLGLGLGLPFIRGSQGAGGGLPAMPDTYVTDSEADTYVTDNEADTYVTED